MTPEENRRRAEDEHVKYIKNHLCDKDGGKPYVFISYKSDDWEIVLHDIVYRLVKDYGLHVYFDGSFDTHNELWIHQFRENMECHLCKGVLAFVDNKYVTSYATVLELMYSQTVDVEKKVVPVNLDKLTSLPDEEGALNTGLGDEVYEDGTAHVNYKVEKDLFNDTFVQLTDMEKLTKATKYAYNVKQHKLTKKRCRRIAVDLLGYLRINENFYYGPNGDLTGIVGSIRDRKACGAEVFDPDICIESSEQVTVTPQNDGERQEIKAEEDHTVKEPVVPPTGGEETTPAPKSGSPKSGRISLNDFYKKYNNSNFKKDTYVKFRLVGTDGYEKYGTEYAQSAYDLSWEFVMKLLAERGVDFIQEVTMQHSDLKFPIFINQDDYNGRGNDQGKYRQIDVPGLKQYYMFRNHNQYQWIASVLKSRLTEFGLPIDKFYFEYVSGNGSLPPAPPKPGNGGTGGPVKPGDITGPVSVVGKKEESVKTVTGSWTLEDFLARYGNKTFQSTSCKTIKLIGVNGCERYTTDKDAEGKPFQSARKLVFHFAMTRIDEMGMKYIETVNNANKDTKNPIFITREEHQKRKERKESVTYTAVTSPAGEGYSMCTHYSEYDWLKNSLVKHLRALGLELKDFGLEFE